MNIWLIIIVIAIISIALSVVALIDLGNTSHIVKAQKKLFKGRVVFQDSSSGELDEESSSSLRSL